MHRKRSNIYLLSEAWPNYMQKKLTSKTKNTHTHTWERERERDAAEGGVSRFPKKRAS